MARTRRGLRGSILASQEPAGAPLRIDQRMTVIAPMIRRRRMSRWPILDTRPRTCFPPEENCRGTRPSQAAKSRPRLNVAIGGANVSIAIAVIGPVPALLMYRDE